MRWRGRAAAAIVFAAFACQASKEEPLPEPPLPDRDGGPTAGDAEAGSTSGDTGAAPPCDVTAPFGEAEALDVPPPSPDATYFSAPFFLPDELAMYVAIGKRPDGANDYAFDIYRAQRAARSEPFAVPELVRAVSTPGANEVIPVVTDDERTLFFTHDVPGELDVDTWFAERPPAAEWSAGARQDAMSSLNGGDRVLTVAGEEVWFVRGNTTFRARYANRAVTEERAYTSLAGVIDLRLTNDRLTAFVTRYVDDERGLDIYLSTRTTVDAEFGPPAILAGPTNTTADERTAWIARDGCRLYFTRRTAATDPERIYVAARTR